MYEPEILDMVAGADFPEILVMVVGADVPEGFIIKKTRKKTHTIRMCLDH